VGFPIRRAGSTPWTVPILYTAISQRPRAHKKRNWLRKSAKKSTFAHRPRPAPGTPRLHCGQWQAANNRRAHATLLSATDQISVLALSAGSRVGYALGRADWRGSSARRSAVMGAEIHHISVISWTWCRDCGQTAQLISPCTGEETIIPPPAARVLESFLSGLGCRRRRPPGASVYGSHTLGAGRAVAHAATKRELVAKQRSSNWAPPSIFQPPEALTDVEVRSSNS
jgi:hypothetical protein